MREIYTERQALQEYIEWIKDERRRLSGEYWKAIERLRELDSKVEATEGSEVVNKLVSVVERQNEVVSKLNEVMPHVPANVVAEYWEKNISKEVTYTEEVAAAMTDEIEFEKDKAERQAPVKRSKKQDIKTLSYEIASFIKEQGVPVRTAQIREHFEGKGYRLANPTAMMNKVMEYHDKVERVSRGFYQYRF